MPYILISTTIRLENGPTVVGDENSNAEIMNYLNAKLHCSAGNTFKQWSVDEPPRLVLDKLEEIGYKVLGMTGCGQTMVWTLHNEKS